MNRELADELKKLSSGLLSRKENRVPFGYFEHLPGQVLKRRDHQNKKGNPVIMRLQKMMTAAAIVSGICFAVFMFSYTQRSGVLAGEITAAEAYDYIINHIDEFDTLLEQPLGLAEENDFLFIEPDAIEDYLLNEIEDSAIDLIF